MLCHAKSLQSCPTLCDPIDGSPPGSPVPGIHSPGKNTGVGCHFLPQCIEVKSESEVTQSCPTLSDPMDCSLPGSSVHRIFQARVLEWGAIAFSVFNVRKCLLYKRVLCLYTYSFERYHVAIYCHLVVTSVSTVWFWQLGETFHF